MNKFNQNLQKVTYVKHWSENLFSFRISRPKSFKFRSGEFVMIGLPDQNNKPILRAYSIASPSWSEELEFYSIIVKDGPLTSKLKNIQINDEIILMPKSTGTLVLDALKPGKRLFLFSSGTGFAPFASLIREPETYEKYNKVIVTHTCRTVKELDYSKNILNECSSDELIKDFILNKLITFHSTTREDYENTGRITDLINNETIFKKLNIKKISSDDKFMFCGSMGLNNDLKSILIKLNFKEGANNNPADFVLEKAFVG